MQIKNLDFAYEGRDFINNLNAQIEKGKITTILGPNGCGKSTLLNLIVHHLRPKDGSITLGGKNISAMSAKEIAKQMAMVHQQNTAPADLTVEKLVRFGRMPHQTMFSAEDENGDEIVKWAMKVTNLENMADKRVGRLSGGERQRAWIAMALAQKTDILFLDEPTTYLDIFYQLEILNLVRRLNREYNMTVVMVLHDINQAIQFSDNLIIMRKGKIHYSGPSEQGITQQRLKEVYGIHANIRWSEENRCSYIVPVADT